MGKSEAVEQQALAKVTDKEENFIFRLYVFTPPKIHKIQMLEEVSSKIVLVPWVSISPKAKLMLRVMALSLLPFKLESGEGTMICNLQHNVTLTYDYGAVIMTRKLATSSILVVEARFLRHRVDYILVNVDRFF